jgi:predicted amino acid-binding ACT domain protein
MTAYRYTISATAPDKLGLFSNITASIADHGGDIDALSQTVVEGQFVILLTATFQFDIAPAALQTCILQSIGEQAGVVVTRFRAGDAESRGAEQMQRYVLTLIGRDVQGLLKRVSQFLEERLVHIADWYIEFEGPVVHIGEILLPSDLDVSRLKRELNELLARTDIAVSIQHDNLFRATCEIGPVNALLNH